MNLLILGKIEQHAPRLSDLIASYRARREEHVRAAIVDAVLLSEVRYLDRDEILHLAWLKASYDQRKREENEAMQRQWHNRLRRERRRPIAAPMGHASAARPLQVH